MSPHTVHFLAQLIRHQRALATSMDKWINSPGFSRTEALEMVKVIRKVLDAYELSLTGAVTVLDEVGK